MSHISMSQFANRLDFEQAQATHSGKQLVQYSQLLEITVGGYANVVPVDHPDRLWVTNGLSATTSQVQWYNTETGVFETQNTRYVPQTLVEAKKSFIPNPAHGAPRPLGHNPVG